MAEHFALRHHLVQLVPPDGFPQRRLRAQKNGLHKVLHLKNGLLGIPHHPEHNRVHIDWNGIARERGFGRDAGHAHALIHEPAQRIHDGNNDEHARAAQAEVASQAQHRDLFPLIRHLDGEHQVQANGGRH